MSLLPPPFADVSHPEGVRPSKYLVCVDESEVSRISVKFACNKARKRGAYVALLHVIPPADVQTMPGVADKMREDRRKEAEKLLNTLAKDAFDDTSMQVSIIIRDGDPGEEIIAQANEDKDINMIVFGMAPDHPNRGNMLSWLVTKLGDDLQIPMMVVPGNLSAEQIDTIS